jgi:hypothetical protein
MPPFVRVSFPNAVIVNPPTVVGGAAVLPVAETFTVPANADVAVAPRTTAAATQPFELFIVPTLLRPGVGNRPDAGDRRRL